MTNITSQDYEAALQRFKADMQNLGNDLISILLYGSLARGDVRPGRSDIMDAYVYLRRDVFENRESFLRALEIMTDASIRLSQTGLPYHPFHYFSEDELNSLPAVYAPTWKRDEHPVVFGEDVRSRIDSAQETVAAARVSFFNTRRTMGYFLSQYLKREFKAGECEKVAKSLGSLRKHLLPMACAVLDIWTVTSESIGELQTALPGLDVSVLPKLDRLANLESTELDPHDVRQTLRETLSFMEDLRDRLLIRLTETKNRDQAFSGLMNL
jgi:predicted nucleotidyltransferase